MKKSVLHLCIVAAALFIVLGIASGALFYYAPTLGIIAAVLCAVMFAALVILVLRYRRVLLGLYETWEASLDPHRQEQIAAFPMPALAVTSTGEILFSNNRFCKSVYGGADATGLMLTDVFTGITLKDLSKKSAADVACGERKLTVYINRIADDDTVFVLYFADNTELKNTATEYTASRPVVLMLCIDNLEEATADMRESARARIAGQIETLLDEWIVQSGGILRKFAGDRFMAVVENRHLNVMTKDRFSILDRVRGAFTADGLTITVSIGVGQGKTMQECESMARQALEMALARGGDQAAIKTVNGFDFYGGRSKGVERRTKVRTRIIANALADLIRSSDRVLVMGHRQSDLDCLGSAIALTVAARRMGKEAVTVVRRNTTMAGDLYDRYVASGNSDLFVEPDGIIESITPRTLLIITDTHAAAMLDCPEIYEAASRVAIIDHHRKLVNHIQDTALSYHEPSSSSACEVVTELLQYMGESLISRAEADALLAGIMLDTRNFVLHTGVRTFEAAAYLRRLGADTVAVKRMFSGGLEMYQKKSDLVSKAEQYHNTAIVTTDADYSDCRAVPAQAADEMLSIQGIKASFVLCVAGDEVIISARSYGECNVQLIMEALGGGGHLTMAGAQLKNITVAEARQRLCAAIDEYFNNNHAV